MDPVEEIIKRFDAVNNSRNCFKLEENEDVYEITKEHEEEEEYQTENDYRKNYFTRGNFRNKLMMSEWMLEIPKDLQKDYFMIPCPVGKRCLVIAMQGQTRAYGRQGHLIYNFHSALPGGSFQTKYKNNSVLLDCIYSDVSQSFHVLDVLSWNRQIMKDTDTEFRFFWLATKFLEFPEIQESTRVNPYIFSLLHHYSCEQKVIEQIMSSPFDYELDGLLFYHKSTYYTEGSTPLAVWLKPYMLPEILNVPVSEKFLALAPITYSGFKQHASDVRTRKLEWQKKMNEKMQCEFKHICEETVNQETIDCETVGDKSGDSMVKNKGVNLDDVTTELNVLK